MKFLNLLVVLCIGTAFNHIVQAGVKTKPKSCIDYIYDAAENNFWDLNEDYFDSYANDVAATDKQFFDKALHYFDSFVSWEKKLNELERKTNFPIHSLCQNDLYIATKMKTLQNVRLISQYKQCLQMLQKELEFINDSLCSLPATKQRDDFIVHYKKGRDLYVLRFRSRLTVLSEMEKMNALYVGNNSSWEVQGVDIVVRDLTFVNKLNECRRRIRAQLTHILY